MIQEISKLVQENLLSGNSKYVHNSYLHFNSLIIKRDSNSLVIEFLHNKNLLAKMKSECTVGPTDSIHFNLVDGTMKIELANV